MRRSIVIAIVLGLPAAAAPAAEKDLPADLIKRIADAAPEEPTAKPKAARNLLVFAHSPRAGAGAVDCSAKAVEVLGTKTGAYKPTLSGDLGLLVPERLRAFDAVVFCNSTGRAFASAGKAGKAPRPEDARRSLRRFVEGGKGAVGIHAAAGECPALFGARPGGRAWKKAPVKLDEPTHPLVSAFGGKGFDADDTILTFRGPYSRGLLRVLVSVDMEKMKLPKGSKPPRADNDYAVSWVRKVGKGRVFYCSLGHRREVFTSPAILKHYLDGIQYALGDLPADDAPSDRPKPDPAGWVHLAAGKDLSAWMMKPGSWVAEAGAMARKGGGSAWTKCRFGDFVLDLEFKVAKGTNSGVFIRTGNVRNCVQTGIEIQVLDSSGKVKPGKHDCGAFYDCLAPGKNTMKPAGEWNRMVITCKGPKLQVEMNGERIIDADLDEWTEPRKNPDGSRNKFARALKDFPREGHVGFQDHGRPVWYRNVKIKPLD